MNFILILAAAGIFWAAAWLAHDWATSHALALAVGEKWSIQSEGWAALWPPVAVGLLAGAVPAFALGLMASRRIAQALQTGKDEVTEQAQKLLSDQRQDLAKKRADIDAEIQKSVQISTAAANQRAENFFMENEKNKDTIFRLQREVGIIRNRLIGSNKARALRKKKAQLMSVNDAKPLQ